MNDITSERTVNHGPFLSGRKTRIHSTYSQETGLVYIYRHSSTFLISNFRRVLNVLCFLLGNPPGNYPEESINHSSTCLQGRAVYAMKEYRRSEHIRVAPFIHLGSRLSPVSSPRPLNQRGQISLYPLKWRRGWPHIRTTRFGENINLLSLLKFEPRIIYPPPSHYTTYAIPEQRFIKCWNFTFITKIMGREGLDGEHCIQSYHDRPRRRGP
jgi:hypothetical protein